MHENQIINATSGFFLRFATTDVICLFTAFNDAGNALQQPGIPANRIGTGTKLFYQHQATALWIHRQHRGHLTTLKNFPYDLRTHSPCKQAVAEGITINFEIAIEYALAFIHFNLVGIHVFSVLRW